VAAVALLELFAVTKGHGGCTRKTEEDGGKTLIRYPSTSPRWAGRLRRTRCASNSDGALAWRTACASVKGRLRVATAWRVARKRRDGCLPRSVRFTGCPACGVEGFRLKKISTFCYLRKIARAGVSTSGGVI